MVGDAVGGHARHALAPAHGAGDLLDEAPPDLGGVGDRRGQHVGDRRGTAGALISTLASASAIASAAGCISAQWKGALTLSGMKRRTPCALASSAARSMAVLAPEMTAWVGSLSLASWHTSPCAASAASFSAASLPTPSSAAMAPCPTGTAACMARPRVFSRRAASATLSAPAAASAEYSPSECPATYFTLPARRKPFSCSSTRMTASDTAISAGWAFSVSVSVSSGPSNMMSESFWPSAASTSSNTARAEA